MNQDDGFLRAILENPDDDAVRLIYADWLDERGDGDRAEFIRLQCELARRHIEGPCLERLRARERQLLERHEVEWSAPVRALFRGEEDPYDPFRCSFHRGFVGSVSLTAQMFAQRAGALFALAPVQDARFTRPQSFGRDPFSMLVDCPYLNRLRTVSLRFGCYEIDDEAMQDLATRAALLERLENLSAVECHLSEVGLAPFVASPDLRRLSSLSLSECELRGAAGVRALAESCRLERLTFLRLDKMDLSDDGARSLAGSPNCLRLRALSLDECNVTRRGAQSIAASSSLGALEFLSLNHNRIGDRGAGALAASPSLAGLTSLHLRNNGIWDAGAKALAGSPYLNRLEVLVLDENAISPARQADLRARFGKRVLF
jgi:uncharacterized protein (TIGR02996 family)